MFSIVNLKRITVVYPTENSPVRRIIRLLCEQSVKKVIQSTGTKTGQKSKAYRKLHIY